MFKATRFLAGLAAALTLSAYLVPGYAQGQDRVPRVMLVWPSPQSGVALDWEDDDSVAMIVMPEKSLFDAFSTGVLGESDYALIVSTIAANRPDLGDDQIAELAAILYAALDDGYFEFSEGVRNVRLGGPDQWQVVYWGGGSPGAGAMAQAGPDGDVIVLGTFGFRTNSGTSYDFPDSAYVLATPNGTPAASRLFQVAIGWFTK